MTDVSALDHIREATSMLQRELAQFEAIHSVRTPPPQPVIGEGVAVARAKRLYGARRRREGLLAELADLFHDPAWDMMLALFIAGEAKREVSITEASLASIAPTTTGIRYLSTLASRGVVSFVKDPVDGRRRNVQLSRAARDRMMAFFSDPENDL